MQLSVTIIAKDAAGSLLKCLKSVQNVSDDIILVIDTNSSDNSDSIGQEFGAQVFTRKFVNFADQKNFAAAKTKYPWVLSLDADELITPALASEILAFSPPPDITGINLYRQNQIFQKVIRHSNWDPHPILRIYDKNRGHWTGNVHEQVQTAGQTVTFRNPVFHLNYQSVTQFLQKQNQYSSLRVSELSGFKMFSLFWDPVYEFNRRFFWHLGFLDGWHGLYLAYLMSVYHLSVHVKQWQKQNTTSA
jgi:glycosyltransferase involved in cell wall biosynthesis